MAAPHSLWSARLEMCQWRRETLDKESIWDEARSTSLSAIANGKTTALACKEAGIVEQTYFRWRKEYGGLQIDQAKRFRKLEQENGKLKRLWRT